MVRNSVICRSAGLAALLFCSLSFSQPTLSSPANGAVNQPLALTLAWSATAGMATYTVQIALTSNFSPTLVNQTGIPVTDLAISGLSNSTTYYWRVEYGSGAGGWTGVWSFGTVPPAPASPVLSSPSNGATSQPVSLTLSWLAVSGATSYALQVSTISTFSNFVYNQSSLTSSSQSVSGLLGGTTYYWQVNAINAGGASAWSGVWSFKPLFPPPTLFSPANNAQNQPLSATLKWNAVANASQYVIELGTTPNFSNSFTVIFYGNTDSTECGTPALHFDSTYYWQVEAFGPAPGGLWSNTWSFTVATLSAPLLSLPANGAAGTGPAPTLSWNPSAGAASYTVQVSSSSSFVTFAANTAGLTGLSNPVTGLSLNATYFWRVNATATGGTSSWSSIWSFSTSGGGPSAPVLSSPTNNSPYYGGALTFSWSLDIGASSYGLQVSSSSAFTSSSINLTGITGTSETVSSLPFIYPTLMILYWHVNASNAGGTSAWSSTWSLHSMADAVLSSSPNTLRQTAVVKNNQLMYSLRHSGPLSISVSDILGRRTVLLDRILPAGSYTLGLKNFRLPPGAYILHFKSADLEKRMVVMLPGN